MNTLRDPLVPRGTTAAAPVPDSGGASAHRRLRRPFVVAGLGAALLVGLPAVLVGGASGAGAISANLPVFPNNINVFPNRDFVNIQGYAEHVGESAKVIVTRPGVGVVGSAVGIISGADVAFEVNHPGGICWGTGGGPNVTPDIQAGDVVSVSIQASAAAPAVDESTIVQDVFATDAVQDGTKVTVSGHIGPDVNRDNFEQRIIEPALVDTAIGKRDIRAVPDPSGVLIPAAKGGYSSLLQFDVDGPNTFRATYEFTFTGVSAADALANATIAANAGLGERAMAWELTDPAANRQGMTIAENGEPGGPGMGGCPNGPLQSGPPAPTNRVAAPVAGGIAVNWTPAVAIPGTPPIDGYEVTAVAQTAGSDGISMIGKRVANPAATGTTITGLVNGVIYDVELVSYSSVGKTFPVAHASVVTDTEPPIISASPSGGSYPVPQQVTLSSTEVGSDIYYTTDGSEPIDGNGDVAPLANHFSGPITISDPTKQTVLKFAGFDPSGNLSTTVTETYSITNDPVPAATSFTTSSVGLNTVTLNWAPADAGAPDLLITGYQIKAFSDAAGTQLFATPTNTSDASTTATIGGLTGDTPFWFTVAAKNSGPNPLYGPASAPFGPITPQGALAAVAGFDQTGAVRGTPVNLTGAGSTPETAGATYQWTQILTGAQTDLDRVTFAPASGQARDVSFTLPFFKFPMSNTPLTFRLTVTVGSNSTSDDVVISPRSDVVSITTAKWKPGDFRVVGVSSPNSIVTVRLALIGGPAYGVAQADATGAFDFRLRTGVPTIKPAAVVADSNMGGTSTPFNVAG